jgi:hypothetical protein
VGKPYAAELESLPDTYSWCLQAPVAAFAEHIRSYSKFPLLAIGSGGSFTSASFCEYLHQVCTGHVAKAVTPLEAVYSPLDFRHTSLLFLTASGKNSDVNGAFTRLVEREPLCVGALCTRGKSPLAKIASSFNKANVFEFDIPTGNDGYLATNSLLATIILLTRAYESARLLLGTLAATFLEILPGYSALDAFRKNLSARAAPLWDRRTLVVLHTPATQAAAIDLESRFCEAALGNVQLADYRNFAHGRHYWLAAQQHTTAIVAFVTREIADLADQTLRLVPDEIPVLRIDLPDEGVLTAIISIIYSLYLAGLAGEAANFDPGKPTVPEFGRRLYNLRAFQKPL